MAEHQDLTRKSGRRIVAFLVLLWAVLVAGMATAGQGNNGLIILLNVSTDGRTLTLTPVSMVQPPPLPVQEPPPPPPMRTWPGMVDVFTRLNVRTGPSTSYPILGTLGPGDPVQIVAQSQGWYEIVWRGRLAWICGTYVFLPGKDLRNERLREHARGQFGPGALPPRPRTPPSSPPPQGVPGQHESDGGLKIPLFNQFADGARKPDAFCGPTSLKMVLAYYGQDRDVNYLADAHVGGATPVYIPGEGAGHQGMLDMLQHCGLHGSFMTHGKSIDWLREQTAQGYPCVVSVAGDFGGGYHTDGHILVVAGVTPSGNVILNDSVGGKRRIVNGSMFFNAWSSSSRMAISVRP